MESRDHKPSRFAWWILEKLSVYSQRYLIKEDLEEEYQNLCQTQGKRRARQWLRRQTLLAVGFYARYLFSWRTLMLKNYLKITIRNIKRHKAFSFINISGLAIGMACSLIIGFYIQSELGFDKYHEKADRIYRINRGVQVLTTPALAPALKENFPEVEEAIQLYNRKDVLVWIKNNTCFKTKCISADKNVFKVFTFPLIYGNPETALEKPYTAVIDEETAHKYFGTGNPVGNTLNLQGEHDFQITGVMKNIPQKSHFHTHIFASIETLRQNPSDFNENEWRSNFIHSYILLRENFNHPELEKKLPELIEEYTGRADDSFTLQPLKDIYLKSVAHWSHMGPVSDIRYVYIFSSVAFLILLIVCFNYMNLATACSLKRSREIGVRKAIGAHRAQLVRQFFSESLLMTFTALIMAVVLILILMKPLSNLIGKDMKFYFTNIPGLLLILGIGIITGLLSGAYPAFYLSAFKPFTVLKGTLSQNAKGQFFRNMLVVVQFTISIFLIVVMLVISNQMHFIQNKKLGFDRDNIVVIPVDQNKELLKKQDIIKTELLRTPGIRNATFSTTIPMDIYWGTVIDYEGSSEDERYSIRYAYVDYDYLDVFGLELLKGRNFSRDFASDITGGGAYILNETVVRQLGWKNPIGKKFRFTHRSEMGTVVGVVRDFHNLPFNRRSGPVVLALSCPHPWYLSIKIHSEDILETMSSIERIWDKFSNGWPFEYSFMDEAYDQMYKSEIRMNHLFRSFSALAIFLSCLGLFGLASFTAERRTKEIGIRKVLGASAPGIFMLLSRGLSKWVLLANIIAWPVAYYFMNRWLQNFAYRIGLSVWIFMLSGLAAFCIALFTVSYQSIKAATANPVESLRYE
jgi:putative ABC transport system permease protein